MPSIHIGDLSTPSSIPLAVMAGHTPAAFARLDQESAHPCLLLANVERSLAKLRRGLQSELAKKQAHDDRGRFSKAVSKIEPDSFDGSGGSTDGGSGRSSDGGYGGSSDGFSSGSSLKGTSNEGSDGPSYDTDIINSVLEYEVCNTRGRW